MTCLAANLKVFFLKSEICLVMIKIISCFYETEKNPLSGIAGNFARIYSGEDPYDNLHNRYRQHHGIPETSFR